MADDQDAQNEGAEGEDLDGAELPDYDASVTIPIATTTAPIENETVNPESVVNPENPVIPVDGDYPDESAEDYVVKLYVNADPPGSTISPDLVNAAITDIYGNKIPTTTLIDSINGYTSAITQEVLDELNGNGTGISRGGKGWWGSWSTLKIVTVGLIALCIIGILVGLICMVVSKKFKKNKRSTTTGGTTTTGAVVTKGSAATPKYKQVPTVV